ncbi:hydroxymethylbilane synthase [Oleidesulfovibrio sp.]|uniref:hydroxymethylbilane synthase n=1 Tax=Oleidesulfovibrio sp. TaxID=2909707 RepID=UPI003A89D364
MKKIVIATRGSKLALWQAEHIKERILQQYPDQYEVELLILKTKGDIILDVPLAKVGGKGLFVKEIEEALLDGRADIAVHSMKDVPMELPEGLTLGAIPEREIPTDSLLSVKYDGLDALPQDAVVGTSSLRRQSQILALRPDLEVKWLRGNVQTRIRKLMEGQYDAIIMATSGLKRLGETAPFHTELGPPSFMPAVGQGALGLEYREGRQDLAEMLAFLNHRPSRICVEAERGFLFGLQGGCQVPIAGYASMTDEDNFELVGLVAELDGSNVIRLTATGTEANARQTGLELAEKVKAAGASEILARVYKNGDAAEQN